MILNILHHKHIPCIFGKILLSYFYTKYPIHSTCHPNARVAMCYFELKGSNLFKNVVEHFKVLEVFLSLVRIWEFFPFHFGLLSTSNLDICLMKWFPKRTRALESNSLASKCTSINTWYVTLGNLFNLSRLVSSSAKGQ